MFQTAQISRLHKQIDATADSSLLVRHAIMSHDIALDRLSQMSQQIFCESQVIHKSQHSQQTGCAFFHRNPMSLGHI